MLGLGYVQFHSSTDLCLKKLHAFVTFVMLMNELTFLEALIRLPTYSSCSFFVKPTNSGKFFNWLSPNFLPKKERILG